MRKLLAVSLCTLVFVCRSYAESVPHWVEVRSPHFQLLTDSNEKEGRKLAGEFERMRALFRTVLPNASSDASSPITVLALKNRNGFQSLVPADYLAKGQLSLAGYFLQTPDRNYILLRMDAEGEHPFSTVFHEYTHFVTRKATWMPLWLSEGIAEFYQNTDIHEKDALIGQPSANDILYLRDNRLIPLPTLFTVDHNSPYYHEENKGSVFYSESWALTHLIEVTDFENKTQHLQDYARLLKANIDPVSAAQQAFGDLSKLQKSLDAYVSRASYSAFRLPSAFTADEASFEAKPVSLDEANAIRADVLASNNRKTEAKALLETVLRNDPKNALAHETMGSLAYRDHDLPAAKKWYGEAVQLDSQSYLAHYYYGILSLMDGDQGRDDSIETSLRAAIKLEPSFAPAYDALAHFYVSRHTHLDEAHMLNLQAVQLEPERVSYRLNAAQTLVEEKNLDAALIVLNETAKHVAKTPEDVSMVQMRITQISEYRDALAQSSAHADSQSTLSTSSIRADGKVVYVAPAPAEPERVLPVPSPSAPRRNLRGVLHHVKCSYPTLLTFTLDEAGKGIAQAGKSTAQSEKSTTLFSPNYFKLQFSTTNFIHEGELDVCKELEGMKARVEFSEVKDKIFNGQIISVELSR